MLTLRLKKGHDKPIRAGYPWAFRNDLIDASDMLMAAPGETAELRDHKDHYLATGTFNARSNLAFRTFTTKREAVDEAFIHARIQQALLKREKLIDVPYYRLVHSESDGLPGLVIDRFADTVVMQLSTAGMELLLPWIVSALDALIAPKTILLRNDISVRELEGLAQEIKLLRGAVKARTDVLENGFRYLADLEHGQKTGWFYDQRNNRNKAAGYAKDKRLLDVYCHSGGFGLLAAKEGARGVTLVDSSKVALELAQEAALLNGVDDLCTFRQGDALDVMAQLHSEKQRFDVVLADPPAFIKSREHLAAGMRGYQRVAQHAAALVEEGGMLKVASCSHHAEKKKFREAVIRGVKAAGRHATVLDTTGAAPDHPIHPKLPQSEYLKALWLRIT